MSDNICWCGKRLSQRVKLPPRRGGENFEFEHGNMKFTASIRYSNAKSVEPVEIFVNCEKIDSDTDLAARDGAILASLALQYGVPLEELAHAVGRNIDGVASSPIGALLDILVGEKK